MALDVVFAEPRMVALDEPLHQLGAELTDTRAGPWTEADLSGKTSIDGVWAAGNSANPGALFGWRLPAASPRRLRSTVNWWPTTSASLCW